MIKREKVTLEQKQKAISYLRREIYAAMVLKQSVILPEEIAEDILWLLEKGDKDE